MIINAIKGAIKKLKITRNRRKIEWIYCFNSQEDWKTENVHNVYNYVVK